MVTLCLVASGLHISIAPVYTTDRELLLYEIPQFSVRKAGLIFTNVDTKFSLQMFLLSIFQGGEIMFSLKVLASHWIDVFKKLEGLQYMAHLSKS